MIPFKSPEIQVIPLFPQEATQTEKKNELSIWEGLSETNPEMPDCTLGALYQVHFKLDAATDQGRGESPESGWD